jgi:translation initiation factor IF-2
LSEQGLTPEAWGGDTIVVQVSALQSLGIDDLLEQLAVVAELEELQASPEARARGVVLEANLESGRGPVATVIVQSGTLRVGDSVVAGAAWGKVKALIDDRGEQVKEAPPSTPVQVLGFSEPPAAGDEFRVTSDQTTARTIGETREHRYRVAGHAPSPTAPGPSSRTSSSRSSGAKPPRSTSFSRATSRAPWRRSPTACASSSDPTSS